MVVVIHDDFSIASCIVMEDAQYGVPPSEPFKEEMRGKSLAMKIPGVALHLREPISGISSGYYVFEGEDKAHMLLARAGMDGDEGDLVAADERMRVHVDFAELSVESGIRVLDDAE